jgi:hypothetical protein
MTEKDTASTKPAKAGEAKKGTDAAHTELRAAGTKPQPRSKVMPPELRDDDDDLFNDMPV